MIELIEDLLMSRNIVSSHNDEFYSCKWPDFLILTHDGVTNDPRKHRWEACTREYVIEKYCEELIKLLDAHPNAKEIVWRKDPSIRSLYYEADGRQYFVIYSRLYLIEEQK